MINSISAATDFTESLDYANKNYDAEQVTRWLDDAQVHDGTTDEFHTRRGW